MGQNPCLHVCFFLLFSFKFNFGCNALWDGYDIFSSASPVWHPAHHVLRASDYRYQRTQVQQAMMDRHALLLHEMHGASMHAYAHAYIVQLCPVAISPRPLHCYN